MKIKINIPTNVSEKQKEILRDFNSYSEKKEGFFDKLKKDFKGD
jgi:DnaJ-class molecular chaperone